jgi:hypothetical protein
MALRPTYSDWGVYRAFVEGIKNDKSGAIAECVQTPYRLKALGTPGVLGCGTLGEWAWKGLGSAGIAVIIVSRP